MNVRRTVSQGFQLLINAENIGRRCGRDPEEKKDWLKDPTLSIIIFTYICASTRIEC